MLFVYVCGGVYICIYEGGYFLFMYVCIVCARRSPLDWLLIIELFGLISLAKYRWKGDRFILYK